MACKLLLVAMLAACAFAAVGGLANNGPQEVLGPANDATIEAWKNSLSQQPTASQPATEEGTHPFTSSGAPTTRLSAVADTLLVEELEPAPGTFVGVDKVTFDNPESFGSEGLLGSTISGMKGREGTPAEVEALKKEDKFAAGKQFVNQHTFTGAARLFSLANNGVLLGEFPNQEKTPLRHQTIVKNEGDKDLVLSIKGVVFAKHTTKLWEDPNNQSPAPANAAPWMSASEFVNLKRDYVKDDLTFAGPHAAAAVSYLIARQGQNGYKEQSLTIPAGGIKVVRNVYLGIGEEAFTLLNMKAADPTAKFSIAQAATIKTLKDADLQEVAAGTFKAAGRATKYKKWFGVPPDREEKEKEDFYWAGEGGRLGRPHGVVIKGSDFKGGRTIKLPNERRTGDIVMTTRFKHSKKGAPDLANLKDGTLTAVSPNPVNSAYPFPNFYTAKYDDAVYGTTYELEYKIECGDAEAQRVDVYATSPSQKNEKPYHPKQGGMMLMPILMNGNPVRLRINKRTEGRLLGSFRVTPERSQTVKLEFTNFGNSFPPMGLEFRAMKITGNEEFVSGGL